MQSIATPRERLFVAGQQIEVWENPELPFGCALTDLETYCLDARWELLFNAMVLAASAMQEENEGVQALQAPARFAWAAGDGFLPEQDTRGH